MKVVKLILVVLALLFGFYLVFALLGPSSLQMQQSLTMHARAEAIYDEVNDLRKWEVWSPWGKMDTAMTNTYSDPSHGINAWVAWQSASLGNGKQVIVANEPYTRIRTQLNFEGWDGDSYSEWHFEESGDSTVVTWTMEGAEVGLLLRPMISIWKGGMKQTYAEGLEALRAIVEAKPASQQTEVMEIDLDNTRWVISLRDTVEAGRMAEVHAQSFARIREFLKEQSLEAYAAPLTIYHSYAATIDLEVGIPVADSVAVQGSFNLRRMDPGKCITATHVGSYANLGETYNALETWLNKHQRKASGPPWEVYITEPASQPDTAQWYTQVFYPL